MSANRSTATSAASRDASDVEDAPVSISALRSRFENLATGKSEANDSNLPGRRTPGGWRMAATSAKPETPPTTQLNEVDSVSIPSGVVADPSAVGGPADITPKANKTSAPTISSTAGELSAGRPVACDSPVVPCSASPKPTRRAPPTVRPKTFNLEVVGPGLRNGLSRSSSFEAESSPITGLPVPSSSRSPTKASPMIPRLGNVEDIQDPDLPPTQLASSPDTLEKASTKGKSKPPPPPPPVSRSRSPVPLIPLRSEEPVKSAVHPFLLRRPITSLSTGNLDDARSPEPSGASDNAATPPSLPNRKVTTGTADRSSALPPPLPINKPGSSSLTSRTVSSTRNGLASPPTLPSRSRAQSIGRSDDPSTFAPAPRFPTRQGIQSLAHSPSLPLPPRTASPQPVLSPSPPQHAATTDIYQPPPPPMRSAPNYGASPPRRQDTRPDDRPPGVSSDEGGEEDEAGPTVALGTAARRMLDEYPDTTRANKRPPKFVPDVKIPAIHQISSFAVFGRYVCVGAHHVRVYDTQMSERPILVVELRDTGLDFRIKEPRVTAMCFRPASQLVDEGRFLWCGTKDGHLWELDIKTGMVTDTRAFAHGSQVLQVLRHQKHLLTLEELGKMHIFQVPELPTSRAQGGESHQALVLNQTIRVADKFTIAKMISGRLWTASGPALRSTTNTAGAKGPTIRVYEPFAGGSSGSSRALYTSEWTGAVTSASVMPLRTKEVYLGHEGGYVSIWNNDDLSCLQVLKISPTDILSLQGVGERLWVGNRKGQIAAYDIQEKPWTATNIWMAHHEHAVQILHVDPWSVEHAGRFICWSVGRDGLRAWDGLLSVDWIDNKMKDREAEFCTYREIKVLVCSWNIDSARPTDLAGSEVNATVLDEILNSVDSPDIVVFGFQEVIPLTDKKLTAKTLLFGSGKGREGSATADKVSLAYRQWLDKLQNAVRASLASYGSYAKVHSESLVGLFTCVFAKTDEKEALRDAAITTVKRGIGGLYGNKGAITARMVVGDTSICFINAHLAAGQSHRTARNADLAGILEEKAIFPAGDELSYIRGGDGTAITDHEMVILNGDLNYRIDQRRENVLSSISAGDLAYLLEHDQLRKEMRNNRAFLLRGFEEAPIRFEPTYKYDTRSAEYDSSDKRRIPAWCDRILFNKSARIQNISYRRYEANISDHRPISAGFKLTVKAVDQGKMPSVRGEVMKEWAKVEAEILDRMASAHADML